MNSSAIPTTQTFTNNLQRNVDTQFQNQVVLLCVGVEFVLLVWCGMWCIAFTSLSFAHVVPLCVVCGIGSTLA